MLCNIFGKQEKVLAQAAMYQEGSLEEKHGRRLLIQVPSDMVVCSFAPRFLALVQR